MSGETTQLVSALLLLATGVFLLALALHNARRKGFTFPQYLVLLFGRTIARWLWRVEIVGQMPLPPRAGAVVVCNHRGPYDQAFIQVAADRTVHLMVAREYCEHPLLSWLFRSVRAIPVGRGGIDTAATKLAIRYAQSGELVGMFPEGRINTTDELLLPGRPGAALVALRARVPIVPCYITGSPMGQSVYGSLFLPAKARLVIGPLLDVSDFYDRAKDREALEQVTVRLLHEIARLAGQENYQPQLAGRHWKPEA